MTTVIEDLLSAVGRRKEFIAGLKLSKVSVSLCYTAVMLSTGYVGLCHTPTEDIPHVHTRRTRNFHEMDVEEAVSLASSTDFLERVVGIATVNALSQYLMDQQNYPREMERDVFDALDLRGCEEAVVVGYIRPLVGKLRGKVKTVRVFERNPQLRGDALPDTLADQFLPRADAVVISGSAVVNGSIDRLLDLSRNARIVALAGPTASFVPEPLFRRGVSVIAGVWAKGDAAVRAVAEAKSFREIKPLVKKYVIRKGGKA